MKLIINMLLLAVLTLGPTMTPKAIAAGAGTPTLGTLAGEYAIRTYHQGYFFSTFNGGNESLNVVGTGSSIEPGRNGKFSFEKLGPNVTLLKTNRGNYVSNGGVGGYYVLETNRTSIAGEALFNIRSDKPGFSPFTIQTYRNFYLAATDGGGRGYQAFSADRVKYQGNWDAFQVLKCGDLGSDYDYAISPMENSRGVDARPLQARNGGGQVQNSVGVFSRLLSNGYQRFKLRRQSDGWYALQTANQRNYLTAIHGGGLASGTKDWDNLVADRTQVQAWEKFRIADRGDCRYSIQTTNNWFVGWHPAHGFSTRISDPNGARSIGYTAHFQLIPFL